MTVQHVPSHPVILKKAIERAASAGRPENSSVINSFSKFRASRPPVVQGAMPSFTFKHSSAFLGALNDFDAILGVLLPSLVLVEESVVLRPSNKSSIQQDSEVATGTREVFEADRVLDGSAVTITIIQEPITSIGLPADAVEPTLVNRTIVGEPPQKKPRLSKRVTIKREDQGPIQSEEEAPQQKKPRKPRAASKPRAAPTRLALVDIKQEPVDSASVETRSHVTPSRAPQVNPVTQSANDGWHSSASFASPSMSDLVQYCILTPDGEEQAVCAFPSDSVEK